MSLRRVELVRRAGVGLICSTLAAGAIPAQVPFPPSTERQVHSLSNIRLKADPRMFAVMAALNAAGFADEATEEMSSARQQFRRHLATLDPSIVKRLADFYESHEPPPHLLLQRPEVPYTSLALWLGPPPDFQLEVKPTDLPPDVWPVKGFEELVRELWIEHGVGELWTTFEPLYRRELELYRPILEDIVRETLVYFRIPVRVALDKQIILIPDLLDVKNIVNARNQEKTYYIVVGPTDDPSRNRRQLQHEYLHFLVDGIVQKFGAPLLKFDSLLNLAQEQPHTRHDYQNQFLLVVAESLIEAIQLRLRQSENPRAIERKLVETYRRGLILTPYFHRGLDRFSQVAETSLPLFIEELLGGIREKAVRKDAVWVREVETAHKDEEARLEQERQEALRHNTFVQRFNQASQLIQEEDHEGAGALLQELAQTHPEKGSVHFYLAQIQFQAGDYDTALESYRKCSLARDVDDWVAAWSRLRAGKILASKGDFASAKAMFEEALTLQGDLRGAQEEAHRLIGQLP